jgi:hypothetical protein
LYFLWQSYPKCRCLQKLLQKAEVKGNPWQTLASSFVISFPPLLGAACQTSALFAYGVSNTLQAGNLSASCHQPSSRDSWHKEKCYCSTIEKPSGDLSLVSSPQPTLSPPFRRICQWQCVLPCYPPSVCIRAREKAKLTSPPWVSSFHHLKYCLQPVCLTSEPTFSGKSNFIFRWRKIHIP